MAALTAAVLALSAANTVSSFAGQRRAATIAEQQGNAEGSQFDLNAQLADSQARDAITRGDQAASRIDRSAGLLAGEQQTAFAGQGIDATSGSASDVMRQDQALSSLDALTTKNNAALEAWGYQTQAAGYRAQGDWARASGRNTAAAYRQQSIGTLLNGVSDLARIYQTAPKGVSRAPVEPFAPTTADVNAGIARDLERRGITPRYPRP